MLSKETVEIFLDISSCLMLEKMFKSFLVTSIQNEMNEFVLFNQIHFILERTGCDVDLNWWSSRAGNVSMIYIPIE